MPELDQDPILQEVRESRRMVAEAARAAGKTLAEYLQDAQKKHPERFVSRGPVRTDQDKATG